MRSTLPHIMAFILTGCACLLAADATQPAAQTEPTAQTKPASEPTTQPASQTWLVRVGKTEGVTQEALDEVMSRATVKDYFHSVNQIIYSMVDDAILDNHLKANPTLVTQEDLDKSVAVDLKKHKVKTLEELSKKLFKSSSQMTATYLEKKRRGIARAKLAEKGGEIAKDENNLRKIFDQNPSHWDGTRVDVYQIFLSSLPYHTPKQKAETRAKLEAIHKDLTAGTLEWIDAVKQSEDRSSVTRAGRVGLHARYRTYYEQVMRVAFQLKVGELSEVFETPFGFHIVKIASIQPGQVKFDQARKMMVNHFRQEGVNAVLRAAWDKGLVVGVRAPEPPPHLKPMIEAAFKAEAEEAAKKEAAQNKAADTPK